MKILHLAAGNRWTGAAAPAFAEVEALRAAGVEAHYAYVGGYRLQTKLAGAGFAHPIIEKAQNPVAFVKTVAAVRRIIDREHIDFIHAHLTYDHSLARFAARGRKVKIARTFHSRRTLRTDAYTRTLLRRTERILVVNDTFRTSPGLGGRFAHYTPPPLDERLFSPDGPNARRTLGLDEGVPVVAVIGKIVPGRGFESALRTFAHARTSTPGAKLMIIGHARQHKAALESLAYELGVGGDVIWAGYHEEDLAEYYRAANALLFTAPGSDEGHRAVIEALGCGIAAATFPVEGVEAVLGPALTPRLMARTMEPQDLAQIVASVLRDGTPLRAQIIERARHFHYAPSARRLIAAYQDSV
ncbi:MAG TPA: glycosyltransferase family 4 protein [Thermoanaerobaculia bacterium]|nr:glycosyltransferase family 4 protein [Thermoanaerobaculia bacterium]